jgi:hypothetical protein
VSEMSLRIERSEAPGLSANNKKTSNLNNPNAQQEKVNALEKYFVKTQKTVHAENPSQLLLKRPEELKKNPFISYTARC